MIYRNGKKIGAVFRNSKAMSQVFRNGKLVYQKAKPEAKRVKSITVSLPAWGTVGRVEWESVLRAVPESISNYYLDVAINGVGVRLRGSGGRYKSVMEQGSSLKINMPDNMFITTDELYVGQVLSFSAKVPSVTSKPTYIFSNNSYALSAFFQFENAPFFNGSKFTCSIGVNQLSGSATYTLNANLSGAFNDVSPAVKSVGSFSNTFSLGKEYKDSEFQKMATYGLATWLTLIPSFSMNISKGGHISKAATLTSPACTLSFKYKIISIETY